MGIKEKMDKKIESARKEIEEYEVVKTLAEEYTDLVELSYGRGYATRQLDMDDVLVDIHNACGCCKDASLVVSACKEIDGVTIVKSPEKLVIGRPYQHGSGFIEEEGWQAVLRGEGFKEDHILIVEEFFDEHPPEEDDLEETDKDWTPSYKIEPKELFDVRSDEEIEWLELEDLTGVEDKGWWK